MVLGIAELYCGKSGKIGYYNKQEIGLARAMKALGYEVLIFYPNIQGDRIEEDLVEEGIQIVYCPAKALGNHSWYNWDIILDYHVDILHIGADNQLFVPELIRYCEQHNIRCYTYVGTVYSDARNKLKRYILNVLVRRNVAAYKRHKCFAKNATIKQVLSMRGVKDVEVAHVGLDISVIPPIIEPRETICKKLNIDEEKTLLLFVARIDSYKRPHEAIKLLELLDDEKYALIVIGTGTLDAVFENSINNCKYKGSIVWEKSVPNTDIHEYYKAADYYLNFNEHEVFGMGILEAMYQGCNVIAVHAPGPDSIIDNNNSGFLVQNLDEAREIIKKDKRLDPHVISKRITDFFTWGDTANKIDLWIKGI